jgi:uncharacterized paraquat-inducible protein A
MDLVKYPEKKAAKYTCPMHPEIIRDEPGDCPICGMDLVRMPDKEDEEDETYNILKRKFIISLAFTIPVFILSMGGMFIDFPFSHQIQGIIELDFNASCYVLFRLVFNEKRLGFFQNLELKYVQLNCFWELQPHLFSVLSP